MAYLVAGGPRGARATPLPQPPDAESAAAPAVAGPKNLNIVRQGFPAAAADGEDLTKCETAWEVEWELTHHEYLGEQVRKQLAYVPTVTRQRFRHEGRITTLIETGKLFEILGVPQLNPEVDRAMICGSPAMLGELSQLLDSRGFNQSSHVGDPGDYVVERAFVAR